MTYAELAALYHQPFFDLLQQARGVFEAHWPAGRDEVQLCTLLSIKTGGCSEDCSYCAQSAHYSTGVVSERLLPADDVLAAARRARANGSTRFCMGAAWRGVRAGERKFEQVLEIVRGVAELGMEVCVTLGQLSTPEAQALKDAGVTAYNHNIDTSPDYYPQIVRTHTFADRLETIRAVQESGMALCCGGIVGLGESVENRLQMLAVLAGLDPAPESVPINCLMAMPGTPLEDQPSVDVFELVRLIAVARIALPLARVRLSAGRTRLSSEGQALCFFAGANSIFYGDKLLTAANPAARADLALLRALDLRPSRLPAEMGAEISPPPPKIVDARAPAAPDSCLRMKKVLPLLLCYVLCTTQLYALSGGPVFTNGISPIGTYSGIIQGVTETDDSDNSAPPIPGDPLPAPTSNTVPSNALGLFDLGIPSTGVATGSFLLFAEGYVFTGTITGSADPDNDKLSGILEATFNFTLDTFDASGDAVSTAVTATAIGKINASVTGSKAGSATNARLTGTANLDISFGQVNVTTLAPIIARSITFTVIGFQQSTSVVATTITNGTGG